MNDRIKKLLFKTCLKFEAAAHSAKEGAGNTIQKVADAGGADALRALIREAGLEEEYRSFVYLLALKFAGKELDNVG